jgi:hypothetical protein
MAYQRLRVIFEGDFADTCDKRSAMVNGVTNEACVVGEIFSFSLYSSDNMKVLLNSSECSVQAACSG